VSDSESNRNALSAEPLTLISEQIFTLKNSRIASRNQRKKEAEEPIYRDASKGRHFTSFTLKTKLCFYTSTPFL